MLAKKITHPATLKMLERAGKIKMPPENCCPKGKKWGRGFSYVDAEPSVFSYKGRKFVVRFADGCLFPFVWENFGGD